MPPLLAVPVRRRPAGLSARRDERPRRPAAASAATAAPGRGAATAAGRKEPLTWTPEPLRPPAQGGRKDRLNRAFEIRHPAVVAHRADDIHLLVERLGLQDANFAVARNTLRLGRDVEA